MLDLTKKITKKQTFQHKMLWEVKDDGQKW